MKKNIFYELYGRKARKREEGRQDKCDEIEKGTKIASETKKGDAAQLICPECKGKRIKPATMTGIAVYGSPDQRYVCEDCGYTGSLVLDVAEQEKSESDIAMEEDLMKIKQELGL